MGFSVFNFMNSVWFVSMVITHLIAWENILWAFNCLKFARHNGKSFYPLKTPQEARVIVHKVFVTQYRPAVLLQKIAAA